METEIVKRMKKLKREMRKCILYNKNYIYGDISLKKGIRRYQSDGQKSLSQTTQKSMA